MRYYFEDGYGSFEACLVAYTGASDAVMVAHTDTGINDCAVRTTHAFLKSDTNAVMAFAREYGADTVELWNGKGYTVKGVK